MIEQINKTADWVAARAVEPSTWRGIGWLLVAAGVLPVGTVDSVVALGVGLVGVVDVVRKESKK